MADNILFITNATKLKELVPEAQWAALCWMNDCFDLGRPFTVAEVRRLQERQNTLARQGRFSWSDIQKDIDAGLMTLAMGKRIWALVQKFGGLSGPKVTMTLDSEHTTGIAADIYPNCSKDKQADWYRDIAEIGKKYGIEQPYTKGRFIDLPHFTFENAKRKPEPRIPATPQEAMRKLQREYRIAKTDSAKKRILARMEEIRSKQ